MDILKKPFIVTPAKAGAQEVRGFWIIPPTGQRKRCSAIQQLSRIRWNDSFSRVSLGRGAASLGL